MDLTQYETRYENGGHAELFCLRCAASAAPACWRSDCKGLVATEVAYCAEEHGTPFLASTSLSSLLAAATRHEWAVHRREDAEESRQRPVPGRPRTDQPAPPITGASIATHVVVHQAPLRIDMGPSEPAQAVIDRALLRRAAQQVR